MRWIVILIASICVCCEELYQLEFQADSPTTQELFIEGFVDQTDRPYKVQIMKVNEGFNSGTGVPGALVELIGEDGPIVFFDEQLNENGVYTYNRDFRVTPGCSYGIRVTLLDGQVFESSLDQMPVSTMLDYDIDWEQGIQTQTSTEGIDIDVEGVYLTLRAELNPHSEDYQMYYFAEQIYQFLQKQSFCLGCPPPPCYVTEGVDTNEVVLFDPEDYTSSGLRLDQFIFREIDHAFLRKVVLSVNQYSVSTDYFHYLNQVKLIVDNSGSIFDVPPGFVQGNIRSSDPDIRVHGFFRAVLSEKRSVAIYPGDIDAIIRDGCAVYFGSNCLRCPMRSSFERPRLYDQVN